MGECKTDQLIIQMKPGDLMELVINVKIEGTNGQSREFLENPFAVIAKSRPCARGESYTKNGECIGCGYGFFLIKAPVKEEIC